MEILFPIVGVTVFLVLFWIASRLRYACIRAIVLIPFKLGEWIVRFWVWLTGSGNRTYHVLATFTIILLAVSILNIAVMTLGDTNLGFSAMWEDNIPAIFRDCQIKGNINSKGDHIYHTLGSPYYHKTRIDSFKGERWFCTVEEAEAAGWRPRGIVKLSEFDQNLGKARIHNSLIVQHSCYWSEVENRPNST